MAKKKQVRKEHSSHPPKTTSPIDFKLSGPIDVSLKDTVKADVRVVHIVDQPKSFYSEYKDYLLGSVNVIITIGVFLLSRVYFKQDRKNESEYQSELSSFESNVAPTSHEAINYCDKNFEDFIQFSDSLKTTAIGSSDRRKLIEDNLKKFNESYEGYLKSSLSKVMIFSSKLRGELCAMAESHYDDCTLLRSNLLFMDLSPKNFSSVIQKARLGNEKFLESFFQKVRQNYPAPK